jgi:lipopolysaccharide export system permease protein
MRNLGELDTDLDSIHREILKQRMNYYLFRPAMFAFHGKKDSVVMPDEVRQFKIWNDSVTRAKYITDEATRKKDRSDSARKEPKIPVPKKKLPVKRKLPVAKSIMKNQASVKRADSVKVKIDPSPKSTTGDSATAITYAQKLQKLDSVFNAKGTVDGIQAAANAARQVQTQMTGTNAEFDRYQKDALIFSIQWHKIIASSFACIAMFLIGAPLGAIIKKGGLGVPFLVSVLFFIIYYVLTIQGEKFAKQGNIGVIAGVWLPDIILLFIGLFFLRQARIDARLFETDFYSIALDKLKSRMKRSTSLQPKSV